MSASYRSKQRAELLPLLCRTGDLQVSDAGKVKYFAEQMRKGVEFRPVKVIVDLAGFYSVSGVEDQILVAASLTAGFDHIPPKIICGPFGARSSVMRVEAKDLEHVPFGMFLQSGCDPRSGEFRDRAASIEIVSEDESEVVEALRRLHDLVEAWQRQRH